MAYVSTSNLNQDGQYGLPNHHDRGPVQREHTMPAKNITEIIPMSLESVSVIKNNYP